ncbi:MFS transporter [Pararhizobium sp. IMCC21322]|uniref:MFS transporter n=1 Tax=Pararhizobium sp. IMCC21322 TaxID=3067903 RepID=UPI002740CC15|nr:MFS transporter [Pararhizobium sp. IMCC21322]
MMAIQNHRAVWTLVLLLVGVMSTSAIVPFMGVYIVEGLGKDPWMISVYSAMTLVVALIVNRRFGEWIDQGRRVAPLVLVCIVAFVIANCSILIVQSYWVLVSVAFLCFGVASAALSTMYSFGRLYAEREGLNIVRYNSYLRSMTSLGWMISPALAFFVAGQFGHVAVFKVALGMAALWLILWYFVMPADFAVEPRVASGVATDAKPEAFNRPLWYAATACFCFSLAHILCSNALPLFYIQEVGLPTFAPGLSFSVKTFVEIIAILSAPVLIIRFGARHVLLGAAVLGLVAFWVRSSVSNLTTMIVGSALEGLYYGIFAGVGITFVQSFAAGRMARATSLYMNGLFLGGLIASSSMGLIAHFYDFRTAIQLASRGTIAAFAVLLATRRSDDVLQKVAS